MLEIMREWLSKTGILSNRDLATTMKGKELFKKECWLKAEVYHR
jgi:hypothetical protein